MSKSSSPVVGADGIAGIVIILAAAALLFQAVKMPTMSAMLPVAMLVFLIVLGAILLGRNVIAQRRGVTQAPVVRRPKRAFSAYFAMVAYAVLVPLIGFYTSTVLMVPIVAWAFGYRNPARLLLATAIFVGSVYAVFNFAMGQQFPAEFFLR